MSTVTIEDPPGAEQTPPALRNRLRSVSVAQVSAANNLFYGPATFEVKWQDVQGQIRLSPPADAAVGGEWSTLHHDDESVLLRVETQRRQLFVGARHWTDYEDEARLLAWALAHEPLLGLMEDALGRPLLPTQLRRHALKDPVWNTRTQVDFSVNDEQDRILFRGRLALVSDWAQALGHRTRAELVPLLKTPWAKFTLPLSLCYASSRVSSDQLEQLSPGDVIVLGQRTQVLDNLVVRSDSEPSFAFHCRCAQDQLTVFERAVMPPSNKESVPMSVSTEPSTSGAEPAMAQHHAATTRPGTIPVSLDFELGKISLNLSEIANIQPGYTFALQAPVEGTNVAICVNQVVVGRGELVVAGDKLGVCVTSWGADGF